MNARTPHTFAHHDTGRMAAGHAVIAAALGLSLLVMTSLAAIPASRVAVSIELMLTGQ